MEESKLNNRNLWDI